jgi:hypothetical protein
MYQFTVSFFPRDLSTAAYLIQYFGILRKDPYWWYPVTLLRTDLTMREECWKMLCTQLFSLMDWCLLSTVSDSQLDHLQY